MVRTFSLLPPGSLAESVVLGSVTTEDTADTGAGFVFRAQPTL